jgi:hypothetical protein
MHQLLKATPARIRFKRRLGQANHFLVTSLVALHTLEQSAVESAPAVLRTSWNPKDKKASIARSRDFVRQSFLGWAVDSVDMYISMLDRKPKCFHNEVLSKELQEVGRSVGKRLQVVEKHFKLSPELMALLDILITWRNNIFHEANDNYVRNRTKSTLTTSSKIIAQRYRGLLVGELASKAESGAVLTFKEVASLISACHHFVEELDGQVLRALDFQQYCVDAVQVALDDRKQLHGFRSKYLGLNPSRRRRFVATWLMNEYGVTDLPPTAVTAACNLSRTVTANKSPQET